MTKNPNLKKKYWRWRWGGGIRENDFFDKLTKNPNLKKKMFFFFFFFFFFGGGGGGGRREGEQMFQMGHFYSSRRTSVPN